MKHARLGTLDVGPFQRNLRIADEARDIAADDLVLSVEQIQQLDDLPVASRRESRAQLRHPE